MSTELPPLSNKVPLSGFDESQLTLINQHLVCDWCDLTMGYNETATSAFTLNSEGYRDPTGTTVVHLCYYCRLYDSLADRNLDTWAGFNAIMDWDIEDEGGYISYNGLLGGQ